jgi:hypothetical protein
MIQDIHGVHDGNGGVREGMKEDRGGRDGRENGVFWRRKGGERKL